MFCVLVWKFLNGYFHGWRMLQFKLIYTYIYIWKKKSVVSGYNLWCIRGLYAALSILVTCCCDLRFCFLTCWMFVLGLRGVKTTCRGRILLLPADNFQAKFLNFLQHHVCLFVCFCGLFFFVCYNHIYRKQRFTTALTLFFKRIIELPVNGEMGNDILVIYSMALFIALCFV